MMSSKHGLLSANRSYSSVQNKIEDIKNKKYKTLLIDLDDTLLDSFKPGLKTEFIIRFSTAFRKIYSQHNPKNFNFLIFKTMREIHNNIQQDSKSYNFILNQDKAAYVFSKNFNLEFTKAKNILTKITHDNFAKLKYWFYPTKYAKKFIFDILNHTFKYNLILATNPVWPRSVVEMRVKWAGLNPNIFAGITNAENMHSTKPHKNYFLEILTKYSLEPSECLFIGNDIKKDLPSIHAGIDCYILNRKNKKTTHESFLKLSSSLL